MITARLNLTVHSGTAAEATLYLTDAAGQPVALGGARPRAAVRRDGGAAIACEVTTGQDGMTVIVLPPLEEGMWSWDFWVSWPDGQTDWPLVGGLVAVRDRVTPGEPGDVTAESYIIRCADKVEVVVNGADLALLAARRAEAALGLVVEQAQEADANAQDAWAAANKAETAKILAEAAATDLDSAAGAAAQAATDADTAARAAEKARDFAVPAAEKAEGYAYNAALSAGVATTQAETAGMAADEATRSQAAAAESRTAAETAAATAQNAASAAQTSAAAAAHTLAHAAKVDEVNIFTQPNVFTEPLSISPATAAGHGATLGQLNKLLTPYDIPAAGDWVPIDIEAAIMAGAILPDDKTGFAHMSAPAGLASITYYGRPFYSPVSVVAASAAACYQRLTGRQVGGLVTVGIDRKAAGFLACPLTTATSGTSANTWRDGTVAFDYSVLLDQGAEGLRGNLILIGIAPASMPGFCSYPIIAAGSTFDEAYMAGVYAALPHDFSYIAVSYGMTGGATVRSHAFYISAENAKATYLGPISWPRSMARGERLFVSIRKNEVGNVVFKTGRIDRYSFLPTAGISEYATDLTSLGGDFLAFVNAGMLSVSNMYYTPQAV